MNITIINSTIIDTVNNYSRTFIKDVFLFLLFALLFSFALITMADAPRRSSRARAAPARFRDEDLIVEDLEMGGNQTHHRPPQTSPGFFQASPGSHTRMNNRRRQQEIRAERATVVGGRRVGVGRGRGRGRGRGAVVRQLQHLFTAVTAVTIFDGVLQDLQAVQALDELQRAHEFVQEHGHPDEYDAAVWNQAQEELNLDMLQEELEMMESELTRLREQPGGEGGAAPEEVVPAHNCGERTRICPHCRAQLWVDESKGICCSSGDALNLQNHFSNPAPEPLLAKCMRVLRLLAKPGDCWLKTLNGAAACGRLRNQLCLLS